MAYTVVSRATNNYQMIDFSERFHHRYARDKSLHAQGISSPAWFEQASLHPFSRIA